MQRRFKTSRTGIDVDLTADEKVFLGELVDLLVAVPADGDDPASQRLTVPVYLDDPDSNNEWWRLMGEELASARDADREIFRRVTIDPGRSLLTVEEADAFLRVLNEGRLAVGARFGVEVEEDHDTLRDDQREILDYLGWLLEELTTELTKAL